MNALSIAYSAVPASIGPRISRCLPPATRLAAAALLFALVAARPGTGRAQYMYLDSNGDGIHTAADQVNPAEPTTFDIWLDTDSNRDGSPVVCAQGSSLPMSILDYGVVLRAAGGMVAWTDFTNRLTEAEANAGEQSSGTEYFNGYGGFPYLAPGLYRLASMTVTPLSGSPSLQIVGSGPSLPYPVAAATYFGTECYGLNFDGSYILGRDWFDVDGLAPGPPTVGHPPVLTQPAAMSVPAGALVTQTLTATDADGQPVAFSKVAGPRYLRVETVDPGRGTATAEAVLSPIYSDVGISSATIEATDGVNAVRKSFHITVTPVPNRAPVLAPMERIVMVAGTTARRAVLATDADGQPVQFSRVSGPEWATVTTLNPGKGGATGGLRLTPSSHDLGLATVAVSASDGVAAAERPLEIEVVAPQPVPTNAVLPWPGLESGDDVSLPDLNGDGKPDLVIAQPQGYLAVALGNGNGTFGPVLHLDLGPSVNAAAVGDLNADGHPDVAAAIDGTNRLVVLIGSGDGTFSRGADYPIGAIPERVVLRDLNADGTLDALVANTASGTISVLLGLGDGRFVPSGNLAVRPWPTDIGVADFDLDGRPDLAASSLAGESVALLHGRGNGTFDKPTSLLTGGSASLVVAADFNWDGIPDIATGSAPSGVRAWLGAGDGTFHAAAPTSGSFPLSRGVSTDWNADGSLDLVIADLEQTTLTVLYGDGDGSFPAALAVGQAVYSLAVGDVNNDGFPDVAASSRTYLNQSSGLKAVAARAFLENPNRAVSLAPSGPDFCVRLEPVGQSYSNPQIDLASVRLTSAGTGSVSLIHAVTGGTGTEGDVDGNGIADIPVCFAGADFQQLFSGVKGRQTLSVRLDGGLVTGQHFSAPLTLTVVGTGRPLAVRVTPNPMNPSGTVTVTTSRDGFLRVRLYDLHGRLVRSIVDVPSAPAGAYEYRVNAGDRDLASGIYFLRVETPEGILRARIAVLK